MKIMTAAIAGMMLAAGAAHAQAPAQDCKLKQYDSIPLEVYPDHVLLPVSFGDKPEKMLLRLDAAANGISADAAKRLDLGLHSMPPNMNFHRDGQDIEYIARASGFHMGRLNPDRLEFLVVRAQRYGDGVIGDIGTHMFENMDMELDLAGAKFNLFSPDHCAGKVVYWTKTPFAQVPLQPSRDLGFLRAAMTLDGHAVTVGLSTGGQSRIGMNAMRRIFGVDETSPDLVPVGQDLLGHKIYRYPFKGLTADGLTVANPAIIVFDEQPRPECKETPHFTQPDPSSGRFDEPARLTRCFGAQDVVLGLSVLSKLHIYVSGKEKLIYLTGAGAH